MSSGTVPSPGPSANPAAPPDIVIPERLVGETAFDRVSSMMMSMVLGGMFIVAWLALLYWISPVFRARGTAPITIVDIAGGGGSLDGVEGSIESVNVDAAAAEMASNNTVDAAYFEEPSLAQISETILDSIVDSATQTTDLAPSMRTGGEIATGVAASRVGTGLPGFGDGGGGGGYPAHMRWSILYTAGQTLDEYARQLDFLKVELGVIRNGRIEYASNFSSPRPTRRTGGGVEDKRLYFIWQGQGRKQSDIELLRRAGIEVGSGNILQFYPPEVEQLLLRRERDFKGLLTTEIRMTRFRVVPRGANNYDIEVVAQVPLKG